MELPRNGGENSNGSLHDNDDSKHKTVINVSGDQFDAPPSVFFTHQIDVADTLFTNNFA